MRNVSYLKLIGSFGLLTLVGAEPASALTIEQARENCRATVGRPIVQACMRGSATKNIEACRAQATPKVRACVQATMQKAHSRANASIKPAASVEFYLSEFTPWFVKNRGPSEA